MRVLHLISGGDTGGAKTHVLTLLKELKKQVDITLLCLIEGIFSNEAIEMGIPTKIINQNKRYDLSIVLKISKYINSNKFDLIHCHGARANFLAIALKPFIKVPIITTIHSDYKLDFANNKYKHLMYTPINSIALRLIPYYIAVTESFKDMLIDRGFNKNNIYVVYNGIDFTQDLLTKTPSDFLKEYNIDYDKDKIYIGNASRLHPVKGIDIFIKGAKEIISNNNNVKFLIAGEGEYRNEYLKLIDKENLKEYVHLLGHVKDMNSFYNTIDINVLASHSESFPYVLLEGARQRKATVSSNVGGISQMIQHNKSGLLFNPGDYKEMASLCSKVIQNKELRHDLGQNFYLRAKKEFSAESMALTHIEIYNNLLKERK